MASFGFAVPVGMDVASAVALVVGMDAELGERWSLAVDIVFGWFVERGTSFRVQL